MKKSVFGILALALFTASGICASAQDRPIEYTIIANGAKITNTAGYELEGAVMLPLRSVAEGLGFEIVWNSDDLSVFMDNGTVSSTVYIGKDEYYASTPDGAVGPLNFGTAPNITDGKTYVPSDLFDMLLGDNSVTTDNYAYTVVISSQEGGSVAVANPFSSYDTLDAAKAALNFEALTPSVVPNGYKLSSIGIISGNTLQLDYTDGEHEICFRTAKGTQDISGDYNIYENTDQIESISAQITAKGSGGFFNNAVWTSGETIYSLVSDAGLTKAQIIEIADNMR